MKINSDKENIKDNTLQIIPKKGEKLSKNQVQFNNLIGKIETLNKKLEIEKDKLERLKIFFSKRISPHRLKIAQLQLDIAKEFASSINVIKFGAKQRREIESVISWLCKQAFTQIEPDEETKTFFNLYSEQTFDELQEEEELDFKQSMSDDLLFNFGIDIDFNEFENTPEGFARLREKLKEEIGKQKEGESQKKRSRREIARELELKKEEAAKLKSIRSIYLSLAKMLHPDTVTDEGEKKIKEELMKKVTVAYNEKNLSELLKLEMQWVSVESKHIDDLPEEKLKLYISNLHEQVDDLEQELDLLFENPKYAEVLEYSDYAEKTALNKIKNLAKDYEAKCIMHEVILRNLSRNQSKRTVLQYSNEFQMVMNFEEINDLDFLFGK